ncbi:MAG: GNAT family N-acetyltransferase [Myxococcaceae bacterium]|nr:GNAT family N-acetyltransferase [Myxococcaceae bacterium]MBH2006237.1 GNAT family N-acetyltransferase [Myxococcaceae bacterium]
MIRKLALEDLGWIAQLDSLCFEKPWSKSAIQEELLHADAHCYGIPEAAVLLTRQLADERWVFRIMTAPHVRRKGYAKQLIKALEGLDLWLEVSELNLQAIAFYENLGFEKICKRLNYYPESAWVMRRCSPKENGVSAC